MDLENQNQRYIKRLALSTFEKLIISNQSEEQDIDLDTGSL